jgi:hypothetical protein
MIAVDGTENKGKLGANAILAVSMAVCKVGGTATMCSDSCSQQDCLAETGCFISATSFLVHPCYLCLLLTCAT